MFSPVVKILRIMKSIWQRAITSVSHGWLRVFLQYFTHTISPSGPLDILADMASSRWRLSSISLDKIHRQGVDIYVGNNTLQLLSCPARDGLSRIKGTYFQLWGNHQNGELPSLLSLSSPIDNRMQASCVPSNITIPPC